MQPAQETKNKLNRRRGIIVWDFDNVLFNTEQYIRDCEKIYEKHNISLGFLREQRKHIHGRGIPYSISLLKRKFKENHMYFPEQSIRKALRRVLSDNRYLSPEADFILRRLKRRGFSHSILSFGSPAYQHQKIKTVCGKKFLKHFDKIIVTKTEKYKTLRKISKKYTNSPIFFIDDTEAHIVLARQFTPSVISISYPEFGRLKKAEENILAFSTNFKYAP